MKVHVNIPMYTQNGGTTKGWRKITKQFNEKFMLDHLTKQKIQSKENELKENYKIQQKQIQSKENTVCANMLCVLHTHAHAHT